MVLFKDVYVVAAMVGVRNKVVVNKVKGRPRVELQSREHDGYFVPVANNPLQFTKLLQQWERVVKQLRKGTTFGLYTPEVITKAGGVDALAARFGISVNIEHFPSLSVNATTLNNMIAKFGQTRRALLGPKRAQGELIFVVAIQ